MKRVFMVFLSALLYLCLTGCSAETSTNSYTAKQAVSTYSYDSEVAERISDENFNTESLAAANRTDTKFYQRKVIKKISLELEVKDFTEANRQLSEKIEAFNGYAESSYTTGEVSNGTARATFTIRIPAENLNQFKEFAETLGNIISTSEEGADVTAEYYDSQARLTVLQAQEKRILELLEKADSVEDVLQIENELTRIRTDIEQLTASIKQADDLVSYATVELNIWQIQGEYTKTKISFWDQLGDAFLSSGESLLRVMKTILFTLIWALPYLLIALIVFLIIWRRRKRKSSHAIFSKEIQQQAAVSDIDKNNSNHQE